MKLIKRLFAKIGIVASGHTISMVINWFFDVILYTWAVYQFGFWGGFAIMLPLSVVINLVLIKIYDKTGKDWLGFEAIKDGREGVVAKAPTWLRKIILSSNLLASIALLFYDPLLATIYMRKLDQAHEGLSGRDWKIFWLSTVLANVGWTAVVFGGVSVFKWALTLVM